MPLIRLPDPSAPHPSEITPPEVYRDRRRFMQAGLALATLPWLAESAEAGLSAQKSPLSTDEPLNKLSDITRYNNFYEFGTDKSDPAANAGSLNTRPWTVRVEGAVQTPRTFDLDALMKLAREVYPAGQAITLRTGFALLTALGLVLAFKEGAKLRLAMAAMGQPETKVGDLCQELGVTRQTLYRHVSPKGELRPDGEKLLSRI